MYVNFLNIIFYFRIYIFIDHKEKRKRALKK